MPLKIITLEEALLLRRELKENKKILVTTNGTFDLLHPAHLEILERAKNHGDILLVLVNSDYSVRLNKDPRRPILPQEDRIKILSALEAVDYTLLFDEKEVFPLLQQLQPDIHVKGGTFIPERIKKEKEIVESYGGKHLSFPLIGNYSTTHIIEEILRRYKS